MFKFVPSPLDHSSERSTTTSSKIGMSSTNCDNPYSHNPLLKHVVSEEEKTREIKIYPTARISGSEKLARWDEMNIYTRVRIILSPAVKRKPQQSLNRGKVDVTGPGHPPCHPNNALPLLRAPGTYSLYCWIIIFTCPARLLIPTPASPSDPFFDALSHISPDRRAGTYQARQNHPVLREDRVGHGTVAGLGIWAVGSRHLARGAAAAVHPALGVSVAL